MILPMKRMFFVGVLLLAATAAQADAIDTLKAFVSEVKTGRASFTQVVTSPDGAKKKTSNGSFEFARPNRFRFAYAKPYEQLIVGDGQKIWLHDPDLNQVTVRPMGEALGSTPAALLAGTNLDKDFTLKALPDEAGLQWVQATPKQKDNGFQSVKVGFKARQLAAVEIVDSFGQRSRLDFTQVEGNAALPADRFRFTPPQGADVLSQ